MKKIRVLYVAEPMLGIGPLNDAILVAKQAKKFENMIDLLIVTESNNLPLKNTKNVTWNFITPIRFNFHSQSFQSISGKKITKNVLKNRANQILNYCKLFRPDVLLLHNYMSGSKWDSIIDFEMSPLINYAKRLNPNIKIYSYMIGMLDGFEHISKKDTHFYLSSVQKNFHKIFIRSDNTELFFQTCPPARKIAKMVLPVGYTADDSKPMPDRRLKKKFIIVSAGGGDDAVIFFKKCIETCQLAKKNHNLKNYNWKFFMGVSLQSKSNHFKKFSKKLRCFNKCNFIVNAHESRLLTYLTRHCLVSVSQCGQRTFTNLEISAAKSIVVPRESGGKEFEQLYRAKYVEAKHRAILIREKNLTPEILLEKLNFVLTIKQNTLGLRMNGSYNLLKYIKKFNQNNICKNC